MSKFKFVGFQEHVEIPMGFELLEVSERIQSEENRDELFIMVGTPSGLSQWFYKVTSLDLRPGGKVAFEDEDGQLSEGRCTAVAMGREISLLADSFGELNIKITSKDSVSNIDVTFRVLTDNKIVMESRYRTFLSQLKRVIVV